MDSSGVKMYSMAAVVEGLDRTSSRLAVKPLDREKFIV